MGTSDKPPIDQEMTFPAEKGRSIRSVLTIIVFLTLVGTTYEFMDTGQVTVWGPAIGFLLGLVLGVFEEIIFAHRLPILRAV